MASSATVTAKTGPAIAVTAKALPNMLNFSIDCARQLLRVVTADDQRNDFDISAATTFTLTFSSGNYTLTVS